MKTNNIIGLIAVLSLICSVIGMAVSDVLFWISFVSFWVLLLIYWDNEKELKENKINKANFLLSKEIEDNEYSFGKKLTSINKDSVIAIDTDDKKIMFAKVQFDRNRSSIDSKIYNFNDILESHIVENGSSISSVNRGSQIGGALVGGVLAGGIGAIIGGLSGSSTVEDEVNKMELIIVINDLDNPIFRLTLLEKFKDIYSIKKSDEKYIAAKKIAEHWQSLMKVVINQNKNISNKDVIE